MKTLPILLAASWLLPLTAGAQTPATTASVAPPATAMHAAAPGHDATTAHHASHVPTAASSANAHDAHDTGDTGDTGDTHDMHDMHDMGHMGHMGDMGDMNNVRNEPTASDTAAHAHAAHHAAEASPAPVGHAMSARQPAHDGAATPDGASGVVPAAHAQHAQHVEHAQHAQHAQHSMPAAAQPTDHAASAMPAPADTGKAHAAHHPAATARADRSPDYSDGLSLPHRADMVMLDAVPLGMLRVDRLEAFHADAAHGQQWELGAWYGGDRNRAAIYSEGEHVAGAAVAGEVETLWSRAYRAFWDTELGVRHDFGAGPSRDWLALGIAGLAPYLFELRATAYLGQGGRSAARFSAAWDWRWTQRWILEPELEANLYAKADPARDIRAGLDAVHFGLRLRYEIRRELAPYVGVVWQHHGGRTARQWVAGVRFWF